MTTDSSTAARRERELQQARERLRLLEIEAQRIKADVARLEAEFADDEADRLSGQGQVGPAGPREIFEQPLCETGAAAPLCVTPEVPIVAPGLARRSPRREGRNSAAQAKSLLASLSIHAVVILVGLSLAYAAFKPHKPDATESTMVFDNSAPPVEGIDGGGGSGPGDNLAIGQITLDEPIGQMADGLASNVLPIEPTAAPLELPTDVPQPADVSANGAAGLAESGKTRQGGREAGSGAGQGTGRGTGRGRGTGSASFFGATSVGDRFVFIVDNSSSMKDGRLEAALTELVRSVDAMERRQLFYVIFVSDQTYPMFYPDKVTEFAPATPENKLKLTQWLAKVRLAGGKNRELIKAVDMAAALEPQAVFLLWDGDLRYSEAVKKDVMTHLTQLQPWTFPIHTLGMGSLNADSEQNLAAIANAHRGVYRRVDVPRPAGR